MHTRITGRRESGEQTKERHKKDQTRRGVRFDEEKEARRRQRERRRTKNTRKERSIHKRKTKGKK